MRIWLGYRKPLKRGSRLVIKVLLVAALFLVAPVLVTAQAERDEPLETSVESPAVQRRAIEHLRDKVNGSSHVTTECQNNGQITIINESTKVTAINGCRVTFETTKLTQTGINERRLTFFLYADLSELTAPSSVIAKDFPRCKPKNGEVLKLLSPVAPGKRLRVSRQEGARSEPAASDEARSTETARKDLSLFFAEQTAAKDAAAALDAAIRSCGGQEWPDEDDLP